MIEPYISSLYRQLLTRMLYLRRDKKCFVSQQIDACRKDKHFGSGRTGHDGPRPTIPQLVQSKYIGLHCLAFRLPDSCQSRIIQVQSLQRQATYENVLFPRSQIPGTRSQVHSTTQLPGPVNLLILQESRILKSRDGQKKLNIYQWEKYQKLYDFGAFW